MITLKFQSLDDVKIEMRNIMKSIGSLDAHYGDFKWFSRANYTSAMEYYGELRNFLSKVGIDNDYANYQNQLKNFVEYWIRFCLHKSEPTNSDNTCRKAEGIWI